MRWAAWVEYTGLAYSGWQKQGHAPSVQEVVEKAIGRVANTPIEVICAGRTDAGVHALGQVVHFDSEARREPRMWVLGANANLPADVCLRGVVATTADFSARYSALWRQYRYVIDNRVTRPALFNKRVTWIHRPLDHGRMHEAAQALTGEHDFSAFRAAGCQARHAIREVLAIQVQRRQQFVVVDVRANAFLHHMVRNIVGVLIAIGTGDQPVSWAREVLETRVRALGGVTAPAYGLYFVAVSYPERFAVPMLEDTLLLP